MSMLSEWLKKLTSGKNPKQAAVEVVTETADKHLRDKHEAELAYLHDLADLLTMMEYRAAIRRIGGEVQTVLLALGVEQIDTAIEKLTKLRNEIQEGMQ